MDEYKTWLEKDQDPRHAPCGLCCKTIDISSLGEAALTSRAEGAQRRAVLSAVLRAFSARQVLGAGRHSAPGRWWL